MTLAASALMPTSAMAQGTAGPLPSEGGPILVDRIVAIVDEEPILLSDLQAEVETYRFESQNLGQSLDESPAEIREKMLDRLIEARLLIAQAKVDGVVLEQEMLERAVGEDVQRLIDRYGTVTALERDLANYGMTLDDFKSRQRELNRVRFYTAQMMRRYVAPEVEVRESDVRAYYDENSDQIPSQPDTVTILSVQVSPKPDSERQEALRRQIAAAQAALQAGRPFEEVAKEMSDGPMAQQGGLLPAFKKGELFDPRLETQAWEMPIGSVSDPISTGRGVHLLQVVERTDELVTLRQIMFEVELSDADREAARNEAQSLAFSARSGQDLAELVRSRAGESSATISAEILGPLSLNSLNPATAEAVQALAVGGVAGPIDARPAWFVLQLKDRVQGRELGYEDVSTQLRSLVEQQRMQEELQIFLAELRQRFYIDVKS